MALYTKCCIMCGNIFPSSRINSTYCGQKCRNKARAFPENMLQALIEKQAKTVVVTQTIPKAVRDFVKKNSAAILAEDPKATPIHQVKDELSLLGVDKTDQVILLEEAKKLSGKRNMETLKKQRMSGLVDPEMMEMAGFGSHEPDKEMLAQQYVIPEDQLPVVETTEEKLEDLLSKVRKPPQGTKTYKIKKFGG